MTRSRDSAFDLHIRGVSVGPTSREAEDFQRWVRRAVRRHFPFGITDVDRERLLGDLGTIESAAAVLADLQPLEPPPRFLADEPRQAAAILRVVIQRLIRIEASR